MKTQREREEPQVEFGPKANASFYDGNHLHALNPILRERHTHTHTQIIERKCYIINLIFVAVSLNEASENLAPILNVSSIRMWLSLILPFIEPIRSLGALINIIIISIRIKSKLQISTDVWNAHPISISLTHTIAREPQSQQQAICAQFRLLTSTGFCFY